jgi:hypothetical protein
MDLHLSEPLGTSKKPLPDGGDIGGVEATEGGVEGVEGDGGAGEV